MGPQRTCARVDPLDPKKGKHGIVSGRCAFAPAPFYYLSRYNISVYCNDVLSSMCYVVTSLHSAPACRQAGKARMLFEIKKEPCALPYGIIRFWRRAVCYSHCAATSAGEDNVVMHTFISLMPSSRSMYSAAASLSASACVSFETLKR